MMNFLIWLLFCLISTLGYAYLFYKIYNFKKVSLFSVILFLLGAISMTLFKYFNVKYYTIFVYFIFYPLLFYSLSKFRVKKIVINTIIIGLIGLFLDLLSMFISSGICYIFDISLEKYYNLFSIFLSLVMFFTFIILGKCNKSRKTLLKIINFFDEIEYIDYALGIFCISIVIGTICIALNLNNIKIDILLFAMIFFVILFFIILIKYKINDKENKKYLETLKENNDFYIKMEDENRIFKHNLMAKLSSIKSVSNKKAVALIDDYVVKTKKSLNYSKRIKNVPYGLNGIIYQKTYSYMDDINFKLTNKIDFDIFNVLKPRRYNVLVEKLVVSLDNAIEASLSSKNKVVVINLYNDEENIYIEIKNSFAHTIDMDNLGNLNYSTKGKRRGLGLFSILRDNEVIVNVKVVNNYFISKLSAKKQK